MLLFIYPIRLLLIFFSMYSFGSYGSIKECKNADCIREIVINSKSLDKTEKGCSSLNGTYDEVDRKKSDFVSGREDLEYVCRIHVARKRAEGRKVSPCLKNNIDWNFTDSDYKLPLRHLLLYYFDQQDPPLPYSKEEMVSFVNGISSSRYYGTYRVSGNSFDKNHQLAIYTCLSENPSTHYAPYAMTLMLNKKKVYFKPITDNPFHNQQAFFDIPKVASKSKSFGHSTLAYVNDDDVLDWIWYWKDFMKSKKVVIGACVYKNNECKEVKEVYSPEPIDTTFELYFPNQKSAGPMKIKGVMWQKHLFNLELLLNKNDELIFKRYKKLAEW
ncbi:MAG: hypothetical protein K9K67_15500 [Bacteriovoracaceae bacterium]|nr:hypothetical protein [Bacteriovoracaceae bacterium]